MAKKPRPPKVTVCGTTFAVQNLSNGDFNVVQPASTANEVVRSILGSHPIRDTRSKSVAHLMRKR